MQRFLRRYRLWLLYIVFFELAIAFGARESFFGAPEIYPIGKVCTSGSIFLFSVFSLYATRQENFFKSIRSINRLWWGMQVGIDLYISVFLSLALIYLVEGSLGIMLLWAIPILIFANLAILPTSY